MLKYFTLIREGLNAHTVIINDLKPDYNNGDWLFDYADYLDNDCITTYSNVYNSGKYHKASYYNDYLKNNRNYNLVVLKIYKNGSHKIFNLGNKYRYLKAPKF